MTFHFLPRSDGRGALSFSRRDVTDVDPKLELGPDPDSSILESVESGSVLVLLREVDMIHISHGMRG